MSGRMHPINRLFQLTLSAEHFGHKDSISVSRKFELEPAEQLAQKRRPATISKLSNQKYKHLGEGGDANLQSIL